VGSTLSFDYQAGWDLVPYGATQDRTFQVLLTPTFGGAPLASFLVLTAGAGTNVNNTGQLSWLMDLSAYAGQDIRLSFVWTIPQSFTGPALFDLDNVASFGFYVPPDPPSAPGNAASEKAPVIYVTDFGSIISALFSSVPTAIALRESSFQGSRAGIFGFNQRLYRLRAHASQDSSNSEFEENRFEEGEGDGPESDAKSKLVKDLYGPAVRITRPLRWEVFTNFSYSNLDMDEDINFDGLRSDTYSSVIGLEYALTPYLTLGLGTSYTTSDVKEGADHGNTDFEGFTFVAYASAYWKGAYADLLYGATFLDNDIDRKTGLGSTAHAEPNSVVQSINFNTGYNFTFGRFVTGPYAGIDYANSDVDGYTEHGGGTANTKISGQSNGSLLTRLGWQVSYNIIKPWGKITPQINAGWERENLDSGDDIKVGLLQSPFYRVQGNTISSAGGSFRSTVATPGRKQDYMAAGAALLVEVGPRFSFALDYQGDFFAKGFSAHYAGIRMGYKF
jgi:uncharacterized protein YhjY with autotransporter beta-barrel domain